MYYDRVYPLNGVHEGFPILQGEITGRHLFSPRSLVANFPNKWGKDEWPSGQLSVDLKCELTPQGELCILSLYSSPKQENKNKP